MYYGKINKCDIANGEGIRVSLFVSGCRNNCPGCFQPETHSFYYGSEFTKEVEELIFTALSVPSVRGLTVLGGEPMEPENQRDLLPFLKEFKHRFPNKTIWIYSGYTYEELLGNHPTHTEYTESLLSLCDVLVDGRFIAEEYDIALRFRGSKNQRIIDLKNTVASGKICLLYD